MLKYTIEQVKRNRIDVTEEMIRNVCRQFAVVEQQSNDVITVFVETVDENVYLGSGEWKQTICNYGVIENGREILWYSAQTVSEFIETYLSQCLYVSQHWTHNA